MFLSLLVLFVALWVLSCFFPKLAEVVQKGAYAAVLVYVGSHLLR